ncbi:B12-binding domain-containing radical SAM protein [bacterium]|nr:B12-binding domain-containing radical SAM protein [bacterium]MBU1884554.1 B12-binding domain-containing radical SAM protein [bacterium]
MNIILTTLNSRFTHSALGLRYIYANMQELTCKTKILEFSINDALQSVAEKILDQMPHIIGIGVYIWNAGEVKELIEIIKKVSPDTIVVLGGPEVSYEPFRVDFSLADFIIQGEGDTSFYNLAKKIINCEKIDERIIKPVIENLKKVKLPYRFYTDEDIKNRYIYVEASRGCPFLCEFCLSSIDEKIRSFDLDKLINEFEALWQRGARNFKFVDRTFNINMRLANKILDFFLSKDEKYFAHFEVIPDHFPDSIKEKIAHFPHGALQLEIGIQTLNNEIANNINRPLKLDKIKENIEFLETRTTAHIHLDLIVGLPGEDLESFGRNLDALVQMSSCEIQIGILKKLSGTTISRHDENFKMVYSDTPPYDILSTSELSFKDIQNMKRFARFWDIFYNSGNFKNAVQLLKTEGAVYENFYAFSLWIYEQTDATFQISLERQVSLLFTYLTCKQNIKEETAAKAMLDDLLKVKGRGIPNYLKPFYTEERDEIESKGSHFNKRQAKHR